ncbi:MAG TPA: ABC transporter substrate-binding protein [Acidimicrobiia bacterium]|nr:ABC transporter substrate-binding protein [Acidimicrobiia bacterium]
MRRHQTRSRATGALVAVLLIASACGNGTGADTTEPAGDTTTPAPEPAVIRVIHGSTLDFIHLVALAAFDILEEEDGIIVENVFAQEAETAVQAVVQGEADVAVNLGVNVGVPAVDAGADIVDVVATQRPTWALAARPEFETMESLQDARIGVHGEASFTRAVSIFFAEEYGYTYEELIIPGSDVRAEALARGELDASVLDLPDIVLLEATFPDSFHILQTIGELFPELIEADVWFSTEWAEANPELATAFVRAIVQASRKMTADTDYALGLALEHLPEMGEDVLRRLVEEYSQRGIWPDNGLMTEERALTTLQFFQEVGEIDIETPITSDTVNRYFDLSYLEAALQQLDG